MRQTLNGSRSASIWKCRPRACVPSWLLAPKALPFRNGQFAAVISNHSLEHFEGLEQALDEIRRVIDPNGFLYIAVPDSSTVTDRIYRWMAQGGGQVNSFTSASVLVRRVSEKTGLPHAGTRVLCTSLSFLNRANITGRTQKKLWLFCGGSERPLRGLTYALRRLDRWFGSRLCIYAGACSWTNVCVRCGPGHPSRQLQKADMGKRRSFQCPQCGRKTTSRPMRHISYSGKSRTPAGPM